MPIIARVRKLLLQIIDKDYIMNKRDFDIWLETMKDSIATWTYYTDFAKVYKNADEIKTELYILNSLIKSKDIQSDFKKLLEIYPQILKAIPILIAKREKNIIINDAVQKYYYNFEKRNYSMDDYVLFMEKTGLFDLLTNHLISNLYDYVLGVETGLDTNARKNRTGTAMEDLVEGYIIKAGFVRDVNYFRQMTKSKIEQNFNIDLSNIHVEEIFKMKGSSSEKRFDFVIITKAKIYLIETNFYSTSGSKLNETARSYKELAMEFKNLPQIKFIWITDGKGWHKTKRNLKETFDILPDLYNINDLDNNILEKIII